MKSIFAAIGALAILPTAAATEVAVTYSDDFTEALTDDYGEREGPRLTQEIVEDLERAFRKAEVDPARVDITIIDAKPNRPTFEQLSARPGLDPIRSISIGGMELVGIAYDDAGNEIATMEYEWFENNIRDVFGSGTWTDAKRASNRFARRFADKLSDS